MRKFYKAPPGSCDILASDRSPSCTKVEQIEGRKVSDFFHLTLLHTERAASRPREISASFIIMYQACKYKYVNYMYENDGIKICILLVLGLLQSKIAMGLELLSLSQKI